MKSVGKPSLVYSRRALAGTFQNRFRRWIDQEKSDIFKPSRFEPLDQPYFGFWLFAWSRCSRIVRKSSRKDSWYQDYSVLLASAPSSCHWQPSAFVPEIARNIWKQAASILVERTVHQNTEVLSFVYFQSNLDHHYWKSWKFPFVASVSGESRF